MSDGLHVKCFMPNGDRTTWDGVVTKVFEAHETIVFSWPCATAEMSVDGFISARNWIGGK